MVLNRKHANLAQKFGIHIEPACRLLHRPGVNLLAVLAEKPIDKKFGRIGMGSVLKGNDMTATAADVKPFFRHGQRFDRQTGFYKWCIGVVSQADNNAELTFGEDFREHALVAAERKFLPDEFAQIVFTLDLAQIRPHGSARTRRARIEKADFTFEFVLK